MSKIQDQNEKMLTKLQDLVTSLERLWYLDEAEELQDLLLNPRATVQYIMWQFKGRLEDIMDKFEYDEWTDCFWNEEWEQFDQAIVGVEKVLDKDIEYTGYKDIVKYDDVYLFYDNVLSRWMVRGHQWLGLSNIEKDNWFAGIRPQEYIERWKGVTEKIRWMPRVQEFTLSEYQRLLDKHWIDIDREEVIGYTKNHFKDYPSIEMIKDMISDEIDVFDYENEWMKQMFKEKIDEEVNKERKEVEERINKDELELRKIKEKAEKEANELKRIAMQSCVII